MTEVAHAYYYSPIGLIELTGNDNGLLSLYFIENKQELAQNLECSLLHEAIIQLDEYFLGKRQIFSLKLLPEGTDFQKKVWNELLKIPFGETISYLELSRRIGDPKAIRAVGGANGRNKISVIIPCHRVIGENGKLVGYGGGLWRKKWLLNHEGSLGELNL